MSRLGDQRARRSAGRAISGPGDQRARRSAGWAVSRAWVSLLNFESREGHSDPKARAGSIGKSAPADPISVFYGNN